MSAPTPTNPEIARALRELGLFLEMNRVPYKPAAYRRAAQSVLASPRPLSEVFAQGGEAALGALPNIGKGIAARIAEKLRTGRIEALEELRAARPVDVLRLSMLEGVGPRMVKVLHDKLGVRTLGDLEAAARSGKLRPLPYFGERAEQRLLRYLESLAESGGRRPLVEVMSAARRLVERLRESPGVEAVSCAGSLRRFCETHGDIDLVVAATRPAKALDAFEALSELEDVERVGPAHARARLWDGMPVDLRISTPDAFGAALLHHTGSQAHTEALQARAAARGLRFDERGLFEGDHRIAGVTEEDVYEALGLANVPPELREGRGEIEAAEAGTLPELVRVGDIRGDLQIQTEWSDGAESIETMVEKARERGWEYIAITDHTRDLTIARGLDEARILEQVAAIGRINAGLGDGFRVLTGSEVNIRQDGTLDVDDEVLAKLDVVGVGIHSHFRLPRAEQTERVIRALENPNVDIFFHPTGRRIGRRPPIDVDMIAVIAAAARTGTVLEVDAQPERMDLKDEHIRMAIDAGVPLVIDSDAHGIGEMRFVDDYGIPLARRGWASRADVLNTRPVAGLLKGLKDGR